MTSVLGVNTEVESIHRSLLRNLGLLGILMVGLLVGTVLYFDEQLVHSLSVNLIDQSARSTQNELQDFFEPAEHSLRVAVRQVQLEDLSADEALNNLFLTLSPFVLEYDRVDGFSLADKKGNSYFLLEGEEDGELLQRFISGQPGETGTARWQRSLGGVLVEQWRRATDYDASQRPWYKLAEQADMDVVRWSEPYTFFTTKEPGITASIRWKQPDTGDTFIAALDISLIDVARFTMSLHPSTNGKVFVFTDEGRVIGLPAAEQFTEEHAFRAALLKPVAELKIPLLAAAIDAWEQRERTQSIFSFNSGGDTWWAGFSPHEYSHGSRVFVGVLMPESDLLGGVGSRRNLALSSIVAGAALVAVFLVLTTVKRVRSQLKQAVTQIERKLGQYRLKYKIGGGGNGDVYLARHALLRRPTAIKIMRPEFARSASAKARFEHEVQITSSLTHPNTVAIYDFGKTPENTLYYVMELLTGYTLENLLRVTGPLEPARVIYILEQVCGSLAEAHGRGLIHRDIKPANIMLCERGGLYDAVKVLDFGLVKEAGGDDPNATQANMLVGTPHYMAPEIISFAGRASPASDLYAVGALAYYLLTGRNVFDGISTVEVCAKHLHDPPVPPSQIRPVPADLEALVMACLRKDPEARPDSAEALAAELHACADHGGWTARDAKEWWRVNQYELPLGGEQQDHTPLAKTQLLVDMDDRIKQMGKTAARTMG